MEYLKQVTVKYSHLQAAIHFAAKNDVRFYLTGILVKDGMIAATDGHAALVCDSDDAQDIEIIIPRLAIESLIKKLGKRTQYDAITISQIDKEFWVMDYLNDVFEMFKPIDGKFPDIKRVDVSKPTQPPSAFVHYNFDYINLFIKCARSLNVAFPKFFPSDADKAVYVELCEDAHGILMPLR